MWITGKDSARALIHGEGHWISRDTSQNENGCDELTSVPLTRFPFTTGQSSPQFVQAVVLFIFSHTLTCAQERVLELTEHMVVYSSCWKSWHILEHSGKEVHWKNSRFAYLLRTPS